MADAVIERLDDVFLETRRAWERARTTASRLRVAVLGVGQAEHIHLDLSRDERDDRVHVLWDAWRRVERDGGPYDVNVLLGGAMLLQKVACGVCAVHFESLMGAAVLWGLRRLNTGSGSGTRAPGRWCRLLAENLAVEADMSEFYGKTHRAFQDEHGTRRLADRLEALAHAEFDAGDRAFIEGAAFFFLSTVDERGRPTVSYKGGAPGFVHIIGPSELAVPVYDGNGMFLSLGNIASTAQVGLLFIDFESARRLRIQGTAQITPNEVGEFPGALYVLRISAAQIFVNCGRYIHKLEARKLSRHVPDESGHQPFPAWKRIDVIADSLSDQDQAKVVEAGGTIPIERYPGEN